MFYKAIKSQLEIQGIVLTKDSHVLDFGVGWGRYMRFFYRDVPWGQCFQLFIGCAGIWFFF